MVGSADLPCLHWLDVCNMPWVAHSFVLARYTFMLWLPFYLQDNLGLEPASAAYVSTMFDIGGGIGSPLCGIVADKLCRT